MKKSYERNVFTLLLVFVSIVLIGACGGQGTETPEATEAAEAETAVAEAEVVEAAVEISEEARATVVAVLDRADAVDGTADHVVEKCANCALMMDGKPEFTTEVVGYEMHFCSDECKDGFVDNVEENLVALEIPDPVVQ